MTASKLQTSSVVGRYVLALYELAEQDKCVDMVHDELNQFGTLIKDNEEFARLVSSPVLDIKVQSKAMTAVIAAAKPSSLTANFLQLLAKNRRLFHLAQIINHYSAVVLARRGEMQASVISAHKLDDTQLGTLQKSLKKIFKHDLALDVQTDASLLGGFVVTVGSQQIDTTLRTKLNNMTQRLKEVG